ncbi:MAG: hypothetical protein PHP93_08590, partial [Kiritimatiellales bacterium]|nr:hypothetical protein [Kiritimatiellales bacterium]
PTIGNKTGADEEGFDFFEAVLAGFFDGRFGADFIFIIPLPQPGCSGGTAEYVPSEWRAQPKTLFRSAPTAIFGPE